jgi:hypothetical protein
MIKSFLSSHLSSAAASEGVIISLKLADTETHGLRLFAAGLLLASVIVLAFHWQQHKAGANAGSVTTTLRTKHAHKRSKPSRRH